MDQLVLNVPLSYSLLWRIYATNYFIVFFSFDGVFGAFMSITTYSKLIWINWITFRFVIFYYIIDTHNSVWFNDYFILSEFFFICFFSIMIAWVSKCYDSVGFSITTPARLIILNQRENRFFLKQHPFTTSYSNSAHYVNLKLNKFFFFRKTRRRIQMKKKMPCIKWYMFDLKSYLMLFLWLHFSFVFSSLLLYFFFLLSGNVVYFFFLRRPEFMIQTKKSIIWRKKMLSSKARAYYNDTWKKICI